MESLGDQELAGKIVDGVRAEAFFVERVQSVVDDVLDVKLDAAGHGLRHSVYRSDRYYNKLALDNEITLDVIFCEESRWQDIFRLEFGIWVREKNYNMSFFMAFMCEKLKKFLPENYELIPEKDRIVVRISLNGFIDGGQAVSVSEKEIKAIGGEVSGAADKAAAEVGRVGKKVASCRDAVPSVHTVLAGLDFPDHDEGD